MPKWSREYLLATVLAGIAAVLGLALAVEWAVLARQRERFLHIPPPKTAPVQPSGEGEKNGFQLPALDDYRQMVERPLFMENRRPGVKTAETPPPPAPSTPMAFKLMGIVWTPQGKTALLMDAKGKYKRLKAKEVLDGWTLVELRTDRVTLQQGGKREELPLLKKRPKPPPSIPPAPIPPAPGQVVPQPQARPGLRPGPIRIPNAGGEIVELPEDDLDNDEPDEEVDTDDDENS